MADTEVTYEGKCYTLLQVLDGSEYLLVVEKDCKFPVQPLVIPDIRFQKNTQ